MKALRLAILSMLFLSHATDSFALDERVQLVEALKIFTNPIWKQTYAPRQRDQLYEPFLNKAISQNSDASASLFLMRAGTLDNKVTDMINFSHVATALSEIVGFYFEDEGRLEGLSGDDADALVLSTAKNLSDALSNITFQEHRVGCDIERTVRWGRLVGSLRTWYGLAERNYWLNADQREELGRVLANIMPDDTNSSVDLSNFLSLKWGLGDTHLNLGYELDLSQNVFFTAGVRAIIPTAFKSDRPSQFVSFPVKITGMRDFIVDRMKEIFIEPQLGNGGHFGAGLWGQFDARVPVGKTGALSLHAHALADYLIPTVEVRYLTRKQGTVGTISTSSTDDQIRNYAGEYVIPEPVTLRVAPGLVAHGTVIGRYDTNAWSWYLGYDGYYKEAENIIRFEQSFDEGVYTNPTLLGQGIAQTSGSSVIPESGARAQTQHKIICGFSHHATYKNVNLVMHTIDRLDASLHAGLTTSVSSKGIGDDFLVRFGMSWRL